MPRYLHQFSYSTDSIKGMVNKPQDRRQFAEKIFSAAGGKVLDMYFCSPSTMTPTGTRLVN